MGAAAAGCEPAVAATPGAASLLDLGRRRSGARARGGPEHREAPLEPRQAAVGVGVPEDVLQADVATEPRAAPDADDASIRDRNHASAISNPQPEASTVARKRCERPSATEHRRAPAGQPRQRSHEVGGQGREPLRALEHRCHVPARVVVGEDRAAQVGLRARGLQVARRGEDRIGGVVRIGLAVAVGVDAVHRPGRGHELHPARRAGARDVEVAAVVRLDLVDRREDLPAHAVLGPRGLEDRQEEDRDAERVDEVARDAGPRHGGDRRERRVAGGAGGRGGVGLRGRRLGRLRGRLGLVRLRLGRVGRSWLRRLGGILDRAGPLGLGEDERRLGVDRRPRGRRGGGGGGGRRLSVRDDRGRRRSGCRALRQGAGRGRQCGGGEPRGDDAGSQPVPANPHP